MKEKLLLIVRPLPQAVPAADLENFRHDLYCKDALKAEPYLNQCSWCGIWMPLPASPSLTFTVSPLSQQLKAVDTAVDALLDECLCQTPCEMADVIYGATVPSPEHSHRRGCADKLKRYSFKRTRISEVPETQSRMSVLPSLPAAPQYYTDESTGECKTQ